MCLEIPARVDEPKFAVFLLVLAKIDARRAYLFMPQIATVGCRPKATARGRGILRFDCALSSRLRALCHTSCARNTSESVRAPHALDSRAEPSRAPHDFRPAPPRKQGPSAVTPNDVTWGCIFPLKFSGALPWTPEWEKGESRKRRYPRGEKLGKCAPRRRKTLRADLCASLVMSFPLCRHQRCRAFTSLPERCRPVLIVFPWLKLVYALSTCLAVALSRISQAGHAQPLTGSAVLTRFSQPSVRAEASTRVHRVRHRFQLFPTANRVKVPRKVQL